jgi:hypothetical protein
MLDCNYLGVVEGSAGLTKYANASLVRSIARHEALEVAAARGATHVRWFDESADWASMHVAGHAFDCRAYKAEPPDA